MRTAIERRRCLALCFGALAVFGFVALQVVLRGPLVAQVDPAVTAWLAAHRMRALTLLLMGVTQLHSTAGIDALVVALALFLGLRQHRWKQALWLALAVESSMLLNVLLKNVFARPRPALEAPLVHLNTFSFPSGHALAATAFWACVVCLLPAPRRGAAAGAAAFVVFLVCVSRVYLGAHFLTDVTAGVCEGLFCVGVWALALPLLPGSGVTAAQSL